MMEYVNKAMWRGVLPLVAGALGVAIATAFPDLFVAFCAQGQ